MIDVDTIYIVIPVYNRRELTRSCLIALERQTLNGFHVVVVDDGCTDGTSEMLDNEFPWVEVLRGDGNLWWTASTNWGVEYAIEHSADYILTLNDDTVPEPDYMEQMVKWASRYPDAILGSCALNIETHAYQDAGSQLDWFRAKYIQLLDLVPESQRTGLHELAFFHGRGCWIPVAVFRMIGLYDHKTFPQLVADEDFTLRAAKRGVKVYVNFDAKILAHEASAIQSRRKYSWENYMEHLFGRRGAGNLRNFFIMAFRHCPAKYRLSYLMLGFCRRVLGLPLKSLFTRTSSTPSD